MLDIGWSELLVIGIVALLVVGPKELPGLLRTCGQWAGRARGMAREFQRSMEEAAREADLDKIGDVKRQFNDIGKMDFSAQAKKAQSFLDSPVTGDGAKKASSATPGTAKAEAPAPDAAPAAPKPAANPSLAPAPAATPAPAQAEPTAAEAPAPKSAAE